MPCAGQTLVMMSCAANGRLLQPDRPATLIDTSVVALAFPVRLGRLFLLCDVEVGGRGWRLLSACSLTFGVENNNPPPLSVCLLLLFLFWSAGLRSSRLHLGTDILVEWDRPLYR